MKATKSPAVCISAALVAVLALSWALHAVRTIRLDNDGMRYALVAEQIRTGGGARKPVLFNSLHRSMTPDSRGTVPYTTQPPFLPLVYAALGGVRPGRLWPGQVVNLCAHLATVLFSFLVARRIAGDLAGAATGIFVSLCPTILEPVGWFWSDALYGAFAITAVAMLQASREAERRWPFLVLSGVAAACACGTRYIGVALMPLFFWEGLVAWRRAGGRASARLVLLSAALPLLVTGALWTRNYLITGTIRGYRLPMTGRGLEGALSGFVSMAREQFGLVSPPARGAWALLLLLVPAAPLLGTAVGRRAAARFMSAGLDLVLVAAACYTGALVYSLAGTQPYFEGRFLAPLAPLLWIAGTVVIVGGWAVLAERGPRRLAHAALALTLAVTAVSEAARSWGEFSRRAPSGAYGFESGCFRWVVAHHRPGGIVATNVPCTLAFFGGVPALCPPCRHLGGPEVPLPLDYAGDLACTMDRVGAEYLLLLRAVDGTPREEWGDVRDGLPEWAWGKFISDLSRHSPPKRRGVFVREYDCPDGVVYRLEGRIGPGVRIPRGQRPPSGETGGARRSPPGDGM